MRQINITKVYALQKKTRKASLSLQIMQLTTYMRDLQTAFQGIQHSILKQNKFTALHYLRQVNITKVHLLCKESSLNQFKLTSNATKAYNVHS